MNAAATIKIRATVTHRTRSAMRPFGANGEERFCQCGPSLEFDRYPKDGAQSRSLAISEKARPVLRRLGG
jgi:hypothetical protein